MAVFAGGNFSSTAYYIVWASQVEDSSFPQAHVAGRNVYVIQPANFTPALVKRLRSVGAPNSVVLLYFDFINLPLAIPGSCSQGHVMGDKVVPPRHCDSPQQPFYGCGNSSFQQSIDASFQPNWMARKLCPGLAPVYLCQYPGLAAHFWSQPTAEAASRLLSSYVTSLGADGVYLDGYCNADTRRQITQALYDAQNITSSSSLCGIDVNGDNEVDTVEEATSQADGWGRVVVAQLRRLLGPDAYILANAAGENADALLNGLTVEMEYCVDQQHCESAFLTSQRSTMAAGVVKSPPLSIAWLKDANTFPTKAQCAFAKALQRKYPFVSVGVDIFDGEVVICDF